MSWCWRRRCRREAETYYPEYPGYQTFLEAQRHAEVNDMREHEYQIREIYNEAFARENYFEAIYRQIQRNLYTLPLDSRRPTTTSSGKRNPVFKENEIIRH